MGFQTQADAQHFSAAARRLGMRVGDGGNPRGSANETRVRAYPVSIAWPTVDERHGAAATPRPAALCEGTKLIVGIDRMDYTKSLLERVRAIKCLLDAQPQWPGRLRLVQVAAPSRTALAEYATFRAQLAGAVGECLARPPGH